MRCTTQSAVISCAASQAGVAAAAGEEAKDNHSIADRSTVRNGLPPKIARKQFL